MRSALCATACAAIVLLALTGCGGGSAPLARVGSHTLTVDDLARLARGNEGAFSPMPDLARAAALDEMVKRELVLVSAHRHGRDTIPEFRTFQRETRDKLLLQMLSGTLEPATPGVSEAELRALYAARATQHDVEIAFTYERAGMDQALAAIRAGMPFERAANQFSTPSTLPPGGALGPLGAGTLPPTLDAAMLSQKVGEVGGPYETPDGWFLLRVVRRTPVTQPPFEELRVSLAGQLRERKQRIVLRDCLLRLERERNVDVRPEAAEMLSRLLTHTRVPEAPSWSPSAEDHHRVLASWDGGRYTLDDMIDDMTHSDAQPPMAAILPSLRIWVEGRVMTRVELQEAQRRHLDEEPEFRNAYDLAVANALLQAEFTGVQAAAPQPGDAETRALWNQAKASNPMLRQAHVQWLSMADTAAAPALEQALAAGRSLRDAARAAAPALVVHDELVKLPAGNPLWAPLVETLMRLAPGQWSGPDFTNEGWRFTQLVDKSVGVVEWDELTTQMQNVVSSRARQTAGAKYFEAYLDSLRRAEKPVLYTENLRRLPWPIPATVDVGR